jgi:hypothetical protein
LLTEALECFGLGLFADSKMVGLLLDTSYLALQEGVDPFAVGARCGSVVAITEALDIKREVSVFIAIFEKDLGLRRGNNMPTLLESDSFAMLRGCSRLDIGCWGCEAGRHAEVVE